MATFSRPGTDQSATPRRRLADSILGAFHSACDERETEVAWRLLDQLELLAQRSHARAFGTDRRKPEDLSAPRERLHNLMLWDDEIPSDCDSSAVDCEVTHKQYE
jgi:hypothetical protein